MGLTNATIVLVTGRAGFIGSHVTAELLRRGRAAALHQFLRAPAGSELPVQRRDPEVALAGGRRGAPVIVADGSQSRDFTYGDNVVAATLLAGESRLDGPLICNVGRGSSHTVKTLARAAGRVMERAVQIGCVPPHSVCSPAVCSEKR